MDDTELQHLLFSAIQHDNVSLLDDLLNGESGKRLLDTPGTNDGNTLLHLAVLEKNLACVECLLEHGANPNVFDTIRARTPLHLAVELKQTDIVKAFLSLDHINLEIRDDRNLTCHEIAQFCDNAQLADLIKTKQDDIVQLRNDFYTVMNQACSSDDPRLVRELLEGYASKIIDKSPRGWAQREDRKLFALASIKELINWSSSSWNDVTLLFKAASKGLTEICRVLIEFGATAKCNENTNYSPLYMAAYGGFTNTVRLLLDNFPSLVREVTIEKWTVLHACCLKGHFETAKLILSYPYPDELKHRYVSRSNVYEYHFAFDLNAQDAAGQTVIYLAVSAKNEKLLDTLLQFNVEARLLNLPTQTSESQDSNEKTNNQNNSSYSNKSHARIIPDRPKLSPEPASLNAMSRAGSQVNKLILQLQKLDPRHPSGKADKIEPLLANNCYDKKYLICPFELDTYCDYNSKTALHLAVCQQLHSIATTLLVNGSNPNLPILSRDTIKSDFTSTNMDTGLNWLRSSKSTCLKEACSLNDELMCEILIRYGASDNQDNLALKVSAANKNNILISKFLSLKSNIDPEYKINKKCNVEFASRYKQSQKLSKLTFGNATTTFSSLFPSSPVMIDWQNLKCIKKIDPQWLIDASLMHNKRLKHATTSLIAITRLDLSSNGFKSVHPVIFRLPSLRELNLSNNRLESLLDYNQNVLSSDGDAIVSTSKLIESHRVAMKRSKSSNLSSINLETSNIIDLNEPQEWDLPYLETLDLHDNRLISLPDCLFELPRLSELDVSSNQIRQLPWSMWMAPALKAVELSCNLLDDLPKLPQHMRYNYKDSPENQLSTLSNLSIEEKSSFMSDQSMTTDKNESSQGDSLDYAKQQSFLDILDPDQLKTVQMDSVTLPLHPLNHWSKKIDLISDLTISTKASNDNTPDQIGRASVSKITYFNLSRNSFSKVPVVLACIATELTRLNLSYNMITELGDIRLYPVKLKSVDLSHNQITTWFVSNLQSSEVNHCYAENIRQDGTITECLYGHSATSCIHKLHQRLDSLKSINLSHNMIKDIQLSIIDPVLDYPTQQGKQPVNHPKDEHTNYQGQVLYPNVTALDLSYNQIRQVPKRISELKDLSVLNLSGNVSISSLPAELGLASKLWNLSISGCSLNEPLKSIVESKTYKTVDIIGYLRSILTEAKAYARMKLMLVGLQGIGKTSLLEQMRLEGTSGSRRRAPEHWTKRMGHTSRSNLRNQRGVTLSTVGVDIHDWIFCKRVPRNQQNFGPVSFSTWDFGGQQEFYATHRYFLSRRSMYLVVWRLTDGISGIQGIQQWLVNIQSRAPSSPVIIVGTHEDLVEGGEKGSKVQQLQAEVHKRFIDVSDHDKCGLPRVMDSVVVSTKSKLNIRNLCNRIYDVVFSLRCPGSTERLLEQKIPATYLYLEEIVSMIVHDRQQKRREPVLTYNEYRQLASEQLKLKYNKVFRDLEPLHSREINYNSELQQATRFLHENGVLLHYEDANLRDLYFLDPQWLCDILSHVVTIREINPHVKNGLMKISDLGFLFKSIDVNLSGGIQSYVVNLLNKFEVALTWNSQYLLIPSLLPAEPDEINEQHDFQVKMAPRMRGRSVMRRYDHNRSGNRSSSVDPHAAKKPTIDEPVFDVDQQLDKTMYRIVLLRYLPAGFLARLQSGILSDPTYDDICADLYSNFAQNAPIDAKQLSSYLGARAGWTCWKSGIKLTLQSDTLINSKCSFNDKLPPLINIQELSTMSKDSFLHQGEFKIECVQISSDKSKQNQSEDQSGKLNNLTTKWCDLDVSPYSNIIIVSVFNWRLKFTDETGNVHYVESDRQSTAKLLASSVDHIDNLLEDWYPSLGTRFAHTLGGSYLVSRIVPCIQCFSEQAQARNSKNHRASRRDHRQKQVAGNNKVNFSLNSATDGVTVSRSSSLLSNSNNAIHCYYVENCILNAYNIVSSQLEPSQRKFSLSSILPYGPKKSSARSIHCPRHGLISLNQIAPDIVFDDVSDCFRIDNDQIERCKLIGRGTFGFVFKGSLRSAYPLNQLGHADQEVALKLLQPVDPGPDAEQVDITAYKSAKSNWIREPFHSAFKSYCNARHEVNILQTLRHPNIVLFLGLCIKPLAIVLELASLGCLTDIFKTYKKAGMRIDRYSVQKTVLQIARALEFLHQQRIIYRDLKAENVLVWNFPSPFVAQPQSASVELKLADYGISRQALSTGIWKGFAGTISFLAPEIMRHNGDEEYTEKVDCFSFGMFMYELLCLRPPYKHNEGIRNHLADGGRPKLTMRDLFYPNYMIDLMSICWAQEPHHRPTASQIVSIASAPEFIQLLDAVALESQDIVTFCGAIQYSGHENCDLDLWFGRQNAKTEIMSADKAHWAQYQRLVTGDKSSSSFLGIQATSICVVANRIWLCDSNMIVHVLPLGFRLQHQQLFASDSRSQNDALNRVQSFTLNIKKSKSSDIVEMMIHVKSVDSVIFLMNNGQLWICQLDTMSVKQLDDGSIPFSCVAVQEKEEESKVGSCNLEDQLALSDPASFHVFCGQSNGVSCLEILDNSIYRQSILPLASKSADTSSDLDPGMLDDTHSGSADSLVTAIAASRDLLWTVAGCTIHLWSITSKCVTRKLDCWKLVPCSESLESINIENYYQESRSSSVRSMVYLNNQLFVGTSHGCFMVVEADLLKPIIVFRPYESDVVILKPLTLKKNSNDADIKYLVTIGSGYRDLTTRYVTMLSDSQVSCTEDVAILWSANYYNESF